jgi:capsular polysaccharide biosynthesis protein
MEKKQTAPVQGAPETEEIDLLDLFSVYLSKMPWLLAAFLIGAILAGLFTHYLITPVYTATSKIYMVSASSGSAIDLTDLNIGTSLSSDYVELMQIRPIYEDVVEELGLDYTYLELQDMVTISSITDTRVMTVTAESADPEEACEIANAVAQKAIDYLPDLMETSEPHIAETAIVPENPSSPSLLKNTVLGAMVALIIVLAVLTVIYLLDDTLKNSDDVEKEFGIIPLTVIPESDIFGGEEKEASKRGRKKK